MAIAYYGSTISPHMDVTPEGFLICRDVPIARTGPQNYLAREMQMDGDPDRVVTVQRYPDDVFEAAALASFEGKPVTDGHPPENVGPENYAAYTKGHVQNVRRSGEHMVADLYINDANLAEEIRNNVKREVSRGYLCNSVPDRAGYRQSNIRGNHVAVVPKGRAGATVAIQDTAPEAEKGRKNCMSKFSEAILTALGMAAKDAQSEDELNSLVTTAATALDAEPAEKAPEAAPVETKPAEDEMTEKAPKGDDLGSKLDRIIAMLEAKSRGGEGEHRLHDEGDIDEEIKRLLGKEEEGKSITIPVENDACMDAATKDAAVALLRKVRPAVASIEDRQTRAKVTDALLSAVRGNDVMGEIAKAAQDSAKATQNQKNTYDTMCTESEASYAARNPHKKKED